MLVTSHDLRGYQVFVEQHLLGWIHDLALDLQERRVRYVLIRTYHVSGGLPNGTVLTP